MAQCGDVRSPVRSAFEQVRCEYAHYRQAFDSFLDRGDAEQAARLVACLRDYWWASELFAEGEERIARLLALPELPTTIHAAVLDQAGALAFAQAEFSRARNYFEAVPSTRNRDARRQLLALNMALSGGTARVR